MTQFESLTITISKREYAELLGKAFAYDAYSKVITSTIDRGGYVTDMERGLFYKEPEEQVSNAEVMESLGLKYEDEEEVKAIFTEEEWEEEIVPLAEEEQVKEEK